MLFVTNMLKYYMTNVPVWNIVHRWEKEGADGWNYQNCLPYFKKAQTHESGENDYRGGSGPLNVSKGISGNLLHEVFIEAATQAGHLRTDDVNGYQQEGFGKNSNILLQN